MYPRKVLPDAKGKKDYIGVHTCSETLSSHKNLPKDTSSCFQLKTILFTYTDVMGEQGTNKTKRKQKTYHCVADLCEIYLAIRRMSGWILYYAVSPETSSYTPQASSYISTTLNQNRGKKHYNNPLSCR